jgi:DSF synthase
VAAPLVNNAVDTRQQSTQLLRGHQLDLWPAAQVQTPFEISDFHELELELNPQQDTAWCYMRPVGVPCFTPTLLSELLQLKPYWTRAHHLSGPNDFPYKYFVGGSRIPGIFNLGGDLSLFMSAIRARNLKILRKYALYCVEISQNMTHGFGLPIITIGLVQGDALGGGFEGALAFNVLIAEERSHFGFPEILFNMFPGMGAYAHLSRKIGPAAAEEMIQSARVYSATELYHMGLIHVLAKDGQGEQAVRDYIAEHRRRHKVQCRVREATLPNGGALKAELRRVAEIWARHAVELRDLDLRRIDFLRKAQVGRMDELTGHRATR